jgi:hypothetical protein
MESQMVPTDPGTPTLAIRSESLEPLAKTDAGSAGPPEISPDPPSAETCPRCGGKLINPEGLGWCSKCGYCKSLEEGAAKVELAPQATRQPSPLGAREFVELLQRLPRWFWVLVGGAAVIALVSFAGNLVLPRSSLPRALFSTLELVIGLLTLLAAQVWALVLIAPDDDNLGPKDVIISVRLWNLTCARLPEMCKQVWLGSWSGAAILSAVFIVGGFDYWYQFYKPKKIAQKSLLQAVAEAARDKGKDKSLEESIEDFANTQDLTKKKEEEKDKNAPPVDKRPTEQCVIIGYMLDKDKTLTGLVVATVQDDRLRFAGIVQRGLTEEVSKELLGRLTSLQTQEPFVRGLTMSAIWVKPKVFCEIHQSGYDKDGHFVSPNFGALLTE